MRWILCFSLLANPAFAEQVSTSWGEMQLNANFVGTKSNFSQPLFLVLHGTWAHSGMEIVEATQQGLADRGYASIAPTLSLGESNRKGFRDCAGPFPMRHEHAIDELGVWLAYLRGLGYREVVLVGHSRGAAQVSLFQRRENNPMVRGLVLLGPMVFRDSGIDLPNDRILHCQNAEADPSAIRSYHTSNPPKHTPKLLEGVNVTTLVLLGSEDEVAKWHDTEISVVRDRDRQSVHVIEGADHFFRDLFLDEILDLVAEVRWSH